MYAITHIDQLHMQALIKLSTVSPKSPSRQAGRHSIHPARELDSVVPTHTFPGGGDVPGHGRDGTNARPSLLPVCIPGIIGVRATPNRAQLHRVCRFPHLAKLLLKAGPSRAHASAVVDIAVHSAVQIVLDGFVTCCVVDI